jgi:sugar phosphate isomerase/epimerase
MCALRRPCAKEGEVMTRAAGWFDRQLAALVKSKRFGPTRFDVNSRAAMTERGSSMVSLPPIGLGCANLLSLSLPDMIDVAGRHGFRRISARPRLIIAEAEAQGAGALKRRLKDANVEVVAIDALSRDLPGVPPPETYDAKVKANFPADMLNPADAETCLRAAVEVGAPILNVVAYMGKVVPVPEMAEAISGLCRKAKPHGVTIALEFFPLSGIPNIGLARDIVTACGESNCGINLDAYHLDNSGGSAEDVRALPAGMVVAMQISDRKHNPNAEYVPLGGRLAPGEGDIPLRDITLAALANNPNVPIELEILNQEIRSMPTEEAATLLAGYARAFRASF